MGGLLGTLLPIIIDKAPDIIDLVGRLFGDDENERKRLAAARELFEVLKRGLNEEWQWDDLPKLDKDKIYEAMKDEDEFVEQLAKVNDAIYQFTKYVNRQDVEDAPF